MNSRIPLVCLLLLIASCSPPAAPAGDPPPQTSSRADTVPPQQAKFEDRLWSVSQSSAVAAGTQYLFRSDGTLEITSPGGKPMIGSWSREGEGLAMVEDSISYRVDILTLTPDSFAIRSHNPGEPVDITMVPATTP